MDFSKEIRAYVLQNAIEFGEADASKILPKLFQHGLKKDKIRDVMPKIQRVVEEVNGLKDEERKKKFAKLKDIVVKRVYQEKDLDELPGSAMGKKMIFRLAPFPSGALHIGNAKTYLLNAIYAERYGGEVILVMDDTIGSSEKQPIKEAYKLIEEAFNWLGVKYKKVVYKSDRIKTYYKYAEELVKKNKAYVCHCTQDELRENRAKGVECSCRQFPPGIQKARWKEMFTAKEGHMTLRIKTDMLHPNPAFRDRVLFKVSDRAHPRVGKKYRVWPSLEMTWAIDDHLLGVTHIVRGNDLMMETEMEKYIWDIFRWKHPHTMHTGLVKIEGLGAKVSKSKAQKEVLSGEFVGWDDPRTWSIQSLARRGFRPESVRAFVKDIGLNKQDITIPIESLYAENRKMIDAETKRYYFVENPKAITLEGSIQLRHASVPEHPDRPEKTREVRVGKKISVSGKDFKMLEGKEVRLLHLFNIDLKKKARITSVENKKIPRIHWVSHGVKTRILMPNGSWVEGAAEEGIEKLKKNQVIQFERFGFCRFDRKKDGVHEFWFSHK